MTLAAPAAAEPPAAAVPSTGAERDLTATPTRRPDRWLEAWIVFLYLMLALWVTARLWRAPGQLDPETNNSDPAFFEWALIHATRIFTHGENPFFSPQLNAPLGVNMMANTGLLGLTVPLVPVTLLFGASVSLLLMLTLGLAATAAAWYYVFSRHLVQSRLAAAVAAGFCGFAPGMVNHANTHPNLVAQFLIPFIIWRALTLGAPVPAPEATRRIVVRRGVVLGLLVVWQAFLNEELLFLYALALAIFVAGYAVFRPRAVAVQVGRFLAGLGVALAVAAPLLAYPLWFQFLGPQHYRGLPEFVLGYGANLATFPAFAKLSLVRGPGNLSPQPEENSFFSWPLLLVLLVAVVWLWRRVTVRALILVGLVFAVLSLGATVQYRDHTLGTGPWKLLNHLPLFDTVVPTRLALVVIPVIGVLIAIAVQAALADEAGASGSPAGWVLPRPARYGWLALLALTLLAIAPRPLPVQPRPKVPAFFTSGDWRAYVPAGDSVLSADVSVWNGGITAMHWGNAAGQDYRVVGGYFLGPDWTGRGGYGGQGRPTSDVLGRVLGGGDMPPVDEQRRARAAEDVRYWHAAIVVLGPGAPNAAGLHLALDQLFGTGRLVDDVWVWDTRDLLR
ncbi:MAG: hypothetical protein J2P15_10120 [Micromonosporaceae bacterium]|nr:hypothetical protein [Micromonosporaceae bacterium]